MQPHNNIASLKGIITIALYTIIVPSQENLA